MQQRLLIDCRVLFGHIFVVPQEVSESHLGCRLHHGKNWSDGLLQREERSATKTVRKSHKPERRNLSWLMEADDKLACDDMTAELLDANKLEFEVKLRVSNIKKILRCFDTIFRRAYTLYFSIFLNLILSSYRLVAIKISPLADLRLRFVKMQFSIDITTKMMKKLWSQLKTYFATTQPATENPPSVTYSVVFGK